MHQIRIITLFFFLLSTSSNSLFSQTKIPSKTEITKLSKQAVKFLRANNYEKSLAASRLTLRYATAINDNYLIAASYNTIGANYDQLSEFDKAIFYYNIKINR